MSLDSTKLRKLSSFSLMKLLSGGVLEGAGGGGGWRGWRGVEEAERPGRDLSYNLNL